MSDHDFKKIMEFFDLPSEEKEGRLKDVFEDAVAYFERFKHIMLNGSIEEKEEALKSVAILKEKIESETKNLCEKTGLTSDQLSEFAENPKNFSEEQWHTISEGEKKMKKEIDEMNEMNKTDSSKEKTQKSLSPQEKEKRKARRRSKKWIQS